MLDVLDQLCAKRVRSGPADGQFVANVMYGFAHLQHRPPQLLQALTGRLTPNYCK